MTAHEYKRITILCGHYGSGKTNIAVNMAFDLRKEFERCAIADLDIVNPYFRTKDSEEDFKKRGIRFICSEYANSNLDIPALPQDIYSITDERDTKFILDIGGDDRGAYVLGRIAPKIKEEGDFDMLMVVNLYRPLTRNAEEVLTVMREIECACGVPFTGIINNSNLGTETTESSVLKTVKEVDRLSHLTGLPVVMTSAEQNVAEKIRGKAPNVFPMILQEKIFLS